MFAVKPTVAAWPMMWRRSAVLEATKYTSPSGARRSRSASWVKKASVTGVPAHTLRTMSGSSLTGRLTAGGLKVTCPGVCRRVEPRRGRRPGQELRGAVGADDPVVTGLGGGDAGGVDVQRVHAGGAAQTRHDRLHAEPDAHGRVDASAHVDVVVEDALVDHPAGGAGDEDARGDVELPAVPGVGAVGVQVGLGFVEGDDLLGGSGGGNWSRREGFTRILSVGLDRTWAGRGSRLPRSDYNDNENRCHADGWNRRVDRSVDPLAGPTHGRRAPARPHESFPPPRSVEPRSPWAFRHPRSAARDLHRKAATHRNRKHLGASR